MDPVWDILFSMLLRDLFRLYSVVGVAGGSRDGIDFGLDTPSLVLGFTTELRRWGLRLWDPLFGDSNSIDDDLLLFSCCSSGAIPTRCPSDDERRLSLLCFRECLGMMLQMMMLRLG